MAPVVAAVTGIAAAADSIPGQLVESGAGVGNPMLRGNNTKAAWVQEQLALKAVRKKGDLSRTAC